MTFRGDRARFDGDVRIHFQWQGRPGGPARTDEDRERPSKTNDEDQSCKRSLSHSHLSAKSRLDKSTQNQTFLAHTEKFTYEYIFSKFLLASLIQSIPNVFIDMTTLNKPRPKREKHQSW